MTTIETLLQDVRRAARVLLGSPGLLVVSVLSLGLGLGVNLTLFTRGSRHLLPHAFDRRPQPRRRRRARQQQSVLLL